MKNSKGITLIALVITIIVLLILAGVSIAMLTGNNGILTRANDAKTSNTNGEAVDRINLELNALYTAVLADSKATFTATDASNITDTTKGTLKDAEYTVTGGGTKTITITYNANKAITGSITIGTDAGTATVSPAKLPNN